MTLKHVQKRGDTFRYRRKVPDELRSIIGKREITLPLGKSEADAARRYHNANAEAERALGAARRQIAVKEGLIAPRAETELERYDRTRKRLRELGFDPDGADFDQTLGAREAVAERIAAKYPEIPEDPDDGGSLAAGHPAHLATEDTALVSALRSSIPVFPPPPTLEDAKRLYIQDRIEKSGAGPKARRRAELRAERVVGHVTAALERDPVLTSLRRADARKVRDHMLAAVQSPATVDRYLNDLRAIIHHAVREMDIGDFTNPFSRLEAAAKEGPELARKKKRPFTNDELGAVRLRILGHASANLKLIWRLLEGTGCRMAEITGLRTADVHTGGEYPYLLIEWHENRRVKTAVSQRRVPLVGDALQAAIEAREAAGDRALVFPQYATENGPNSASAALQKHVRAITTDPKASNHSLRHGLKDKLRLAGVSLTVENMILGHSGGGVGENYGGEEARLKVASEAMRKALGA